MKNLYLFFQISVITFKVLPVRHNAFVPTFFQSSKQSEKFFSGMAFNTFFDSAFTSSIESKRYPQSGLLSLLNSQKSHGAKSGEYGNCRTIWVEFLTKCSRRINAVWDGALSPIEIWRVWGTKPLLKWFGLIQMKCPQHQQSL